VNPLKLEQLRRTYGDGGSLAAPGSKFKTIGDRFASTAPIYSGAPTLLGARFMLVDWTAPELAGIDVAMLGIPTDRGVTNRSGCRFGPRALRAVERVGGYNHVLDCAPLVDLRVADVGDAPLQNRFTIQETFDVIERTIDALVEQRAAPLSVGGDHSISLPILRALGRREAVGLVHIDAHCDTSSNTFSHGGPFRQAVLDGVLDPERTVQIGIRGASEYRWEFSYESGMKVIHAEEIDHIGIQSVIAQTRAAVGAGPVYISFDVDALDPAFAPGTGTPEIGGLTTREALALLRGLKGLSIIGGDVVEICPQFDPTSNTAQTGAQILFEILSLLALSPAVGGKGTA
jgi:guanidinopropionase